MMVSIRITILLALCLAFSSAEATLVGRLPATSGGTDFQAYYDTVTNLTWLADANAIAGTAFDDGADATDGRATWASASAWAAQLNVNGVTGWRLPETVQPDPTCEFASGSGWWGGNCTGSEMGNLYYNVLGNSAGGTATQNSGPFSNVTTPLDSNYWSSTNWIGPGAAWFFNMKTGAQFHQGSLNRSLAWAVHTGDVGVVPVPAAVWLFGSGLMGLFGVARRKNN